MLVCKKLNDVGNRDTYAGDFQNVEVQGKKEFETLCPISKLTGYPLSMQELIFMITDKNARLADALFEVIPEVPTDDRISDDDKLRFLVSRLDTGSFAENDKVAESIGKLAKEFFPDADVEQVIKENSEIQFTPQDVPSPEA